jgi:hypothetical protein
MDACIVPAANFNGKSIRTDEVGFGPSPTARASGFPMRNQAVCRDWSGADMQRGSAARRFDARDLSGREAPLFVATHVADPVQDLL